MKNINSVKYPIIVAITGASGMLYAFWLIEILDAKAIPLNLIITLTARKIITNELSKKDADFIFTGAKAERHDPLKFESELASGSNKSRGMVIVPASMGTIGRIACGVSDNLVVRAADVHLKERRKLIIVPRETPLNRIHLENLLKLNDAGAVILPAMPSFYSRPKTLVELADTIVARILDHLDIEHNLDVGYHPDK